MSDNLTWVVVSRFDAPLDLNDDSLLNAIASAIAEHGGESEDSIIGNLSGPGAGLARRRVRRGPRLPAGSSSRRCAVNGPDHYREAERLLASISVAQERARAADTSGETLVAVMAQLAAEAQAHATLALAAATAYPALVTYTGDEDGSVSRSWAGVA